MINKCSLITAMGLMLFLSIPSLHADNQPSADQVTPNLSADELRDSLQYNFTDYLASLISDPKARETYIREFLAYKNLSSRFQAINKREKEAAIVEIEARKRQIFQDAVIKAELEAENKDIEALAKDRYLANKDTYKTPRRIKLSQIFLAKKSSKDNSEVKKLAEDILKQLETDNLARNSRLEQQAAEKKDGEKTASEETDKPKTEEKDLFAELAKQYSEDANAALGGFDPRWIVQPKEEPTEPVAKAALSLLQRGEMTGVVEGRYGYHILRLVDYVPNRQQEFDEVKDQIIGQIKQELWGEKDKQVMAEIAAPKELVINDELAAKIIKETYDARDESLKKTPELAGTTPTPQAPDKISQEKTDAVESTVAPQNMPTVPKP